MRWLGKMRSVGLLLVLALVAALAAQPMPRAGAQPPDPALAAYLAMGGTLEELCGGGPDGHGTAGCPHCDGCQSVVAVAVARPEMPAVAVLFAAGPAVAGPRRPEGRRRLEPHGPRGPPIRP